MLCQADIVQLAVWWTARVRHAVRIPKYGICNRYEIRIPRVRLERDGQKKSWEYEAAGKGVQIRHVMDIPRDLRYPFIGDLFVKECRNVFLWILNHQPTLRVGWMDMVTATQQRRKWAHAQRLHSAEDGLHSSHKRHFGKRTRRLFLSLAV